MTKNEINTEAVDEPTVDSMDNIIDTQDCRDMARDAADECEAETCQPGADCEAQPETQAEDAPDTQQTFLAVCSLTLNELTRAIAKYPEFYHSSNEAHGTVTIYTNDVLDILKKIRVVGSKTFSGEEFDRLSAKLFVACVKLNVVVAKTIISFCETRPLADRFSEQQRQKQNIAQALQAEDPTA